MFALRKTNILVFIYLFIYFMEYHTLMWNLGLRLWISINSTQHSTQQFSSLFALYDASKCKIRYQWVQEDYIWKLQNLLFFFFSNGTAKTKLAILAFLCYGEFVKTSISSGKCYRCGECLFSDADRWNEVFECRVSVVEIKRNSSYNLK